MKDTAMKGSHMQSHAVSIEHQLRTTFDSGRYALGGFINSDHIRSVGFIPALILLLSKKYIHTGDRRVIDDFINDILHYSGTNMDDLDEDTVEDILEKFQQIKKKIS